MAPGNFARGLELHHLSWALQVILQRAPGRNGRLGGQKTKKTRLVEGWWCFGGKTVRGLARCVFLGRWEATGKEAAVLVIVTKKAWKVAWLVSKQQNIKPKKIHSSKNSNYSWWNRSKHNQPNIKNKTITKSEQQPNLKHTLWKYHPISPQKRIRIHPEQNPTQSQTHKKQLHDEPGSKTLLNRPKKS